MDTGLRNASRPPTVSFDSWWQLQVEVVPTERRGIAVVFSASFSTPIAVLRKNTSNNLPQLRFNLGAAVRYWRT
jgi:hypothetical protein